MKILKVVKIGGNIIDDEKALQTFIKQFAQLEGPKVLVHGGGKLATQLSKAMNVEVKMVEGRRITDADTLDIITMVYGGKINKNLVALLQASNCNAVGFTGADGNSIVSVKRPVKTVDYGFVGDVTKVNIGIPSLLLNTGVTPVFCAITHDGEGQLLNTNADTITSELAIAFSEEFKVELYYCFEKSGVLEDVNDESSVIQNINSMSYKTLLENGIIADGMLPKMKNCFHALHGNVSKVCIGKMEMLFNENALYTTLTL